MNKLLLSILISTLFFILCNDKAKATHHLMGSELTFTCIGKDSFIFNLTLYRDCSGSESDTVENINISSSCSTFSTGLSRDTVYEVKHICADLCTQCDSTSCSFQYGIEKSIYTGLVVLPQNSCCEFKISWADCCRKATNIDSSQAFYIETKMYRCLDSCNNSPQFTEEPFMILCRGQQMIIRQGVTEYDGDSLVFMFAEPLKSDSQRITYIPFYTYLEPLRYLGMETIGPDGPSPFGFHINSQTGDVRFIPTQVETSYLSILIQEFRNDTLISEVRRDLKYIVINCDNERPFIDPSFSFNVCVGSEIVIPITIWDPDSTGSEPDSVFLEWDHSIPGAKFEADPAPVRTTGYFKWTPDTSDIRPEAYKFNVTGHDNACPFNAYIYRIFNIFVKPKLIANYSFNVFEIGECGRVDFFAELISDSDNDAIWDWQGEGGLNSNDSTFTHHYPAGGQYPFTLTVTANGCQKVYYDTIVVPDFPHVDIGTDLIKCHGDILELEAMSFDGVGQHSYSWSTGDTNKILIREMIFIPDTIYIDNNNYVLDNVRTKTLIVQVEDAQSCINFDTIIITIQKLPEPDLGSDMRICEGTIHEADAGYPEYTHEWFEISNPSIILSTDQIYSIQDSGTYVVRVIDTSIVQCVNYDTINVIVDPLVVVPLVSGPDEICEADSAIYTIDNYNPALEYFWMCSGSIECLGAAGSSAWIKFTKAEIVSFEIYVNSPHSCGIESYTKDVLVNPLPQIPVITGKSEVCERDSLLYSIDNYDPDFEYEWNCTGSAKCDNAAGSSAWIKFTVSDSAFVEVKVSSVDACGSASRDMYVLVNPFVIIPVLNGPVVVCEEDSVLYSIDNYDVVFDYAWKCTGTAECSDIDSDLIWVKFKSFGDASVEVVVNSVNGCGSDSNALSIIVEPIPEKPVITGQTEVCEGDSLVYTIDNYDPEFNYIWNCTGSAECSDVNENSAWVKFPASENAGIEVFAISKKGCISETQLIDINVNTFPTQPLINGPDDLCEGDSAFYTIENYDPDFEYEWNCSGTANCIEAEGKTALVKINGSGTAYIEVIVSSPYDCGEQSYIKVINTHTLPEIPEISGPEEVQEGSFENYLVTNVQEGVDYTWQCIEFSECAYVSGEMANISFTSDCNDAVIEVLAENMCGLSTNSKVVFVKPDQSVVPVSSIISAIVFPNPGKGQFTLKIETKFIEKLNIEIFNALGQIIYHMQLNDVNCSLEIPLNIDDFASGSYYILLKTGEEELLRKIVIE